MNNAVQIVTIKEILPLYKDGNEAERIELIQLEENGFDLVSQKGLYQPGDKVVYIQPDYCLSENELFEGFIKPNGDESKSMLGKIEGKPRRIKAKKFNFTKSPDSEDKVYSNGILLPAKEVEEFLFKKGLILSHQSLKVRNEFLDTDLGVSKYEEPENFNTIKVKNKYGETFLAKVNAKAFPQGVYKTDETNIHNLWNHIENKLGYPIQLVGTEKIDGSSITFGIINGEPIICSRNLKKQLTIKVPIGKRDKTFLEHLMFWKKPDLTIYEEVTNNGDDFVKYGKPLLDELIWRGYDDILFRGELNGSHLRGSGNKNNPARNEEPNIKIFGIDYIENGVAVKISYDDFINECDYLDFTPVKTVFCKTFNSREEIEKECENYFKNNMVEGIVLRTENSLFSAKYMNNLYDSLK